MREITSILSELGWSWAYRTIDARAFGLPQRRRRVVLLASRTADPRPILLGADSAEPSDSSSKGTACGFYWTEGHRGLGWAVDAIPPLKGGSGLAIPSPPAIWFPSNGTFAVPSIEDAERLQGFAAGWTKPAVIDSHSERQRWRLVGNAVSVPLAEWLAKRLSADDLRYDVQDRELPSNELWPDAAWGKDGTIAVSTVSAFPVQTCSTPLVSFLKHATAPLSHRAAAGFLARLEHSGLRCPADFKKDLRRHVSKSKPKPSAADANTSRRMAATRGHDNPSELALRSALFKDGFRFRVHYKPLKSVRRTADIAFPSLRVAIFLDGCFWHGCPLHGTWPKKNAKWWREKIQTNRKRDKDTDERLRAEGWQVLRIWEHEDADVVFKRLRHILRARKEGKNSSGRRRSRD